MAFGALLPSEAAGLQLGNFSPTRTLNLRTGRNWSAWQWQQILRDDYERIVAPKPRINPPTPESPTNQPT